MTDPILIRLDGEPRGKGRPRFGRGRVHTDAATTSYEAQLRWAAVAAMQGRQPIEGPIKVHVYAEFPIPASWAKWKRTAAMARAIFHSSVPDLDNLVKSIDALNGIVWKDDSQVACLTAWKKYGPDPHVKFVVTGLAGEPA